MGCLARFGCYGRMLSSANQSITSAVRCMTLHCCIALKHLVPLEIGCMHTLVNFSYFDLPFIRPDFLLRSFDANRFGATHQHIRCAPSVAALKSVRER